jgi:hypothetical protein
MNLQDQIKLIEKTDNFVKIRQPKAATSIAPLTYELLIYPTNYIYATRNSNTGIT